MNMGEKLNRNKNSQRERENSLDIGHSECSICRELSLFSTSLSLFIFSSEIITNEIHLWH